MIKASDFQEGELQTAITQLREFRDNEESLKKHVNDYFQEFDSDKNGYLDVKELRHFI